VPSLHPLHCGLLLPFEELIHVVHINLESHAEAPASTNVEILGATLDSSDVWLLRPNHLGKLSLRKAKGQPARAKGHSFDGMDVLGQIGACFEQSLRAVSIRK